MRRMLAFLGLVGVLFLGSGALPVLSPAAGADGTDSVLLSPPDGHVFTNQWWEHEQIVVDLSEAGDTNPDHQWEVSFRDDSGTWHVLRRVWGMDKTHIDAPHVGPGNYAVRVDPLWLGDTQTVVHEVTVIEDPEVWVGATNDFREPYFHGQVRVRAHLSYPLEPREGDVVQWVVYRRDDPCGYEDNPPCPRVVAGTIIPAGGAEWVDLPLADLPAGTFEVLVYREMEPDTDRYNDWFTVLPAPEATDLTTAPGTFYPHVEDGYRDRTTLAWKQNLAADTAVDVIRDGSIIRAVELGTLPAGHHTWTWDGRDDGGDLVATGTYRMRVRVTDGAANVGSAATAVEVATATVTRRASIERRGPRTSTRTTAGRCGFRSHHGKLTLACSGGRYAQAAYVFHVPRSAFDLRWEVDGRRGCCAPGRVLTSGERLSATCYRVAVRVTNRRSYTIARAELRYRYKVRR